MVPQRLLSCKSNDIGDVGADGGASHLVEVLQREDAMAILDLVGNPISKTRVNKLRSASQGDHDLIGDKINGDVAKFEEFKDDARDGGDAECESTEH